MLLLILPALGAVHARSGVWGPEGFVALAGMLLDPGAAIQLFAPLRLSIAHRLLASACALLVFVIVYAELAVGIF